MDEKKFQEYEQSKPIQLKLFENNLGLEKKYSNTIELYDTLPKYFYGNQEKIKTAKGDFLPILERKFEYQGIKYSINISPAGLLDKNGKTVHYYPSQREELVEDVLRKIACEGRCLFLDEYMGYSFSLYEIQQELQKTGHGYNLNEIKDALNICAGSIIEIKSEDGTISLKSAIFSSLGLKGINNHTQSFIRFNPLVTKSINEKTYRQLNYPRYMSHKKMLSRWLHKRLSHYFTQASEKHQYQIKLTTLVTNSGMNAHKQITNTRTQIISSFKELIKNNVLEHYEFQNLYDGSRKNKITDIKFTLYPHKNFINDVIKANLKRKKLKEFVF